MTSMTPPPETVVVPTEDDGASATPTGLSSDGSSQPEAGSPVPASIPSAGATSLRGLGVEEWDATCDSVDTDLADEMIVEGEGYGRGREIGTLINGPKLFAGHYPIGWVDDSDPDDIDDWEVRFFRDRAHWEAAVASAIEARRAETQGGSVHENASDAQRSPA